MVETTQKFDLLQKSHQVVAANIHFWNLACYLSVKPLSTINIPILPFADFFDKFDLLHYKKEIAFERVAH